MQDFLSNQNEENDTRINDLKEMLLENIEKRFKDLETEVKKLKEN